MASKNESFSLNQRQDIRFKRYEKQLSNALEVHLAKVKQIEKDWDIFKEQNSQAFKLYNRTLDYKTKDKHYQLSVNESANWTLISQKKEQKEASIVTASNKYKEEHKRISQEKDQFYAECVKEWKREQQGKGLYDTSSSSSGSEEDLVNPEGENQQLILIKIKIRN